MVRARAVRAGRHHDRGHRGRDRPVVAGDLVSTGGFALQRGHNVHPAHVRPNVHSEPGPRFARWRGSTWRARKLYWRPPFREAVAQDMKFRILAAITIASLAWLPASGRVATAIYCYPGDPPDVYQACVAYNAGINQQVNNQQQLQNIQNKIHDVQAQINAYYALIHSLNNQIAAQQALIAQTKEKIVQLDRQIRFRQGELTRLQADVAVRDQLLDQRMRYVDGHGPVNYVELVLTASTFHHLLTTIVATQQIAASDRKLLDVLAVEHTQVTSSHANLASHRTDVQALLLQH